jgi:hypothetical protein
MGSRGRMVVLAGIACLVLIGVLFVLATALVNQPQERAAEPLITASSTFTATPSPAATTPAARITVVPAAERATTATATPTPTPLPTEPPAPTLTTRPQDVIQAPTPTLPSSPLSAATVAPTVTESPPPVASPSPSPQPTATPRPTSTATATREATPAPTVTVSATPVPTRSPTPTHRPTSAPTQTPVPSPTPTSVATPTAGPSARITGRLVVDGVPAAEGVRLTLEDPYYNVVGEVTVQANGLFAFVNLPASSGGYNVLFSQERNPVYATDEVVSWGWVGPVALAPGGWAALPDFDVALRGLNPTRPGYGATVSASALSAEEPLTFEWSAYPGASAYWVDLVRGEEQVTVWQSDLTAGTSVAFDGVLDGGASIEPGEYWWGVGARQELGAYETTVFGYLSKLTITP